MPLTLATQNGTMPNVSELYEQHTQIRRLCGALIALVSGTTPPAAEQLARQRWLLSSAITRHMADEDRLAKAPLAASSDHRDKDAVQRYLAGHCELRTCMAQHNVRWTTANVLADLDGFRQEFAAKIAQLDQCMRWEEQYLYPLARQAQDQAVASPAFRYSGQGWTEFPLA